MRSNGFVVIVLHEVVVDLLVQLLDVVVLAVLP